MSARDDATVRQVQAADPHASTWLSANAGSGKTRVLTDRVARLLLNGVAPQRVLCLTYTKAAASEMQNRLFGQLGRWAMLPDADLRAALAELGAEGRPDVEALARARRLFARAIETPGGLKIQTIHAFCASLLRRFPLEAGVSPGFAELDDRSAEGMRAEIVEEMAEGAGAALVEDMAAFLTDETFADLTAAICGSAEGFLPPRSEAELAALVGHAPGVTAEALIAEALPDGALWLREVAAVVARGKPTDAKLAETLLSQPLDAPDLDMLAALEAALLTGPSAKEPFRAKIGSLPTKDMRPALGPLLDPFEALMARVEAIRPRRLALLAYRRTCALHRFATAFLARYEAAKARSGRLDFDDLIGRARALLTDPSVAQWVLFRLDGGIDHILVDEAQDTSPAQWQVIELLAQEFTAGRGAREVERTIFVVGDKKQSIYSFQGADLAAFDKMQEAFATRLAGVGLPLGRLTLEHSFRSSPAILRVVDLTFDARRGAGLGGATKHIAFRQAMPGRVDLWPVIPPSARPEEGDWTDPVDLIAETHHDARLADRIAAEVARLLAAGTRVPGREGPRPMGAGDVLILVRRRGPLFHQIIRACKAAGLPIAGADRLKLGGEIAVRDIRAMLAFLATPEDSLSLAAVLRSPLCGWSEGELYRLAQPRTERHLWEALRHRRGEFPATLALLDDLRRQADFLRPYELIERLLLRHDGRRRLLARLGVEAEDGIDELLGQALAYERAEVPSLTGFLGWLSAGDVEVKRRPEAAGGRIRVMTVHGAKGLEAPVVILPDTMPPRRQERGALVPLPGGAAWAMTKNESPAPLADARAEALARQREEDLRLLYVAMTRAQSWLIVCGAGENKGEDGWHDLVAAGMAQAGALALAPLAGGEPPVLRHAEGDWPADAPAPAAPETVTFLPDWAGVPPAAPAPAPGPLSPSALGGAKALPGEGRDEAAALLYGTRLHLLLERLPELPPPDWPTHATALLAGTGPLPAGEARALLAEATAVLTAPALAPLFAAAALTEVAITADLGARRLLGTIDRLIPGPGHVLAVDYKSNAVVPARPEEVPEGLLRQMGAYAVALAQVYPGRRIETALLWTRSATLMPLPDALVMAALRSAPLP